LDNDALPCQPFSAVGVHYDFSNMVVVLRMMMSSAIVAAMMR
jgi:hypothetical protein